MIPRPSALAVLVAGKKGPRHPRGKESAVPRIDSRKCLPEETKGKNKTDLPTNPKWQIGLLLCLKPYRGGAARRRGSEASPSGESPEGISPLGDSLVTFSSGEKVTRGRRGGAPSPWVERRGGQSPPRYCAYSSQSCSKVQNALSAVFGANCTKKQGHKALFFLGF